LNFRGRPLVLKDPGNELLWATHGFAVEEAVPMASGNFTSILPFNHKRTGRVQAGVGKAHERAMRECTVGT
jgi:hypothetical protein